MRIIVTAAVIEDHGRYLVTRRQHGVHLEGYWEFPGGKLEAGESLHDGLKRELKEELGVEVTIGDEILAVAHEYPDRHVELHFFACAFLNAPMPLLGQEMRWVPREDLRTLPFPPADEALIARLSKHGA